MPDKCPRVIDGHPLPGCYAMSMHFHPQDKSSLAMFWRSHGKFMTRLHAFADIQKGPNPLTEAELELLASKYPERWGLFAKRK